MFLTIVGIDGCLLFQRSAQVLHGVLPGFHYGAIGLQNADIGHLDAFVGGVVSEL